VRTVRFRLVLQESTVAYRNRADLPAALSTD
jgi:hypothetical protein